MSNKAWVCHEYLMRDRGHGKGVSSIVCTNHVQCTIDIWAILLNEVKLPAFPAE
jgi:hypothetical protein